MTPKTLNSDQKKEGNKDSSGIDCGGEGRGRGGRGGEVRGKGRERGGRGGEVRGKGRERGGEGEVCPFTITS